MTAQMAPLSAPVARFPDDRSSRRRLAVLAHGLALAEANGRDQPTLEDAIWELLIEAAETLKRLPDRDRAFLAQGTRSAWPETVSRAVDAFATAVAKGGRWEQPPRPASPPSAGAIDRLDDVMAWFAAVRDSGRGRRRAGAGKGAAWSGPGRNAAVLFALAAGIPVAHIRARVGLGRSTIYDIRDKGLGDIALWLKAAHLGLCPGS